MDSSRILSTLLEDVIHSTLVNGYMDDKHSRVMGNPKRFAAYFPSKASLNAKFVLSSEDDSTWEFSAPVSLPSRSSSSTSCNTSGSTPAQEIIRRYRASHSDDQDAPRSSSESQSSTSGSWRTSPDDESDFEYVPIAPVKDTQVVFRHSRDEALLNTYQEAQDVMKAYRLGPNDRVVCQRPGCRDTLQNVKALMYHLHIHDIHDRSAVCPHCKGRYEGQREMSMHNCRRRPQSTPSSPIRDGFLRVVNNIASHF